jgi:hypothetical protein
MKRTILALAALLASSCTSSRNYAQAIVALVDVSGTYVDQKDEVVNIIRRGILPKMNPGDSLFVIRIDGESYKRDNLEGGMTLDVRPSRANAQKLAFATQLDKFAHRVDRAKHTDIRGAMMLGAEYLKETGAGNRTMIVFSDMEEDLGKGVVRNLAPDEFSGMRIVAMNVKKLSGDNRNPGVYRDRLAGWKKQAISHGARDFQVLLESDKLEELIDEAR